MEQILKEWELPRCETWDVRKWLEYTEYICDIESMISANNHQADSNTYHKEFVFTREEYEGKFPTHSFVRDPIAGQYISIANPPFGELPKEPLTDDDDAIAVQEIVYVPDGVATLGKEMLFGSITCGGNVALKDTIKSKVAPVHRLPSAVTAACDLLADLHKAHSTLQEKRIELEGMRGVAVCSR